MFSRFGSLKVCFLLGFTLIPFFVSVCSGNSGASDSKNNGKTNLAKAATKAIDPIPEPSKNDPKYLKIKIDSRVSSGHTVHLTVTANKMLLVPVKVPPDTLPKPVIEKITWLTGGLNKRTKVYDDWDNPVFQKVDSTDGVATGPSFKDTYDILLADLPKEGKYWILKIPFLDPDDATFSLGGSGHVTITLDSPAVMQINTRAQNIYYKTGFAFALPSPDFKAASGKVRWDFIEFNNATPAVNGKNVSFVNTTNVDFFSLGLTIEGRTSSMAANDNNYPQFGLDLIGGQTVKGTVTALNTLSKDYTKGLVSDVPDEHGVKPFLRFQSPAYYYATNLTDTSTALDCAINAGYEYYKATPLKFTVNNVDYEATSDGSSLAFTKPSSFSVDKPTTLDVFASTGPLDPGKGHDDATKFIDAYLNRGVFQDTSVWQTFPDSWYPAGCNYNGYSGILHQKFIDGHVYGFSFDDVPSDPNVPTAPAIGDCTSMTLVISD